MERYRDIDGDSGVAAYAVGGDFIRVQFKDRSVYRYTYASAGQQNAEQMKILAAAGDGLNAFINRHVRELSAAEENT